MPAHNQSAMPPAEKSAKEKKKMKKKRDIIFATKVMSMQRVLLHAHTKHKVKHKRLSISAGRVRINVAPQS